MTMNKKAINILEFDKIRVRLAENAGSAAAKRRCEALVPMTDQTEIEAAQGQTGDALSRLFSSGNISFSGLKDITPLLKRLESGGILNAPELLALSSVMSIAERAKKYSEEVEEDSLSAFFEALSPLTLQKEEIRRCILSEDEIADDASPALRDVRRRIKTAGDRIHEQLQKLVNGSLRTYLQEAVVTMRGERYCVPVKAEYKSQVPGMIHDQSSSGSTYFIEPASVVSLNNDLKELFIKEEQEIEKVLASLSADCSEKLDELYTDNSMLAELDFIFAKAKLAMDMNATRPVYGEERIIHLRKARHPLLDKKRVVPVDISLGGDYSLLVVTGPNTGGKTVSLKTCGLIAAMGQAGLHIPCGDRSQLAVFDDIYADIGDEQSIEQSLSTFSSHMKNIIYILKHADENSLCLFDELCAGTDPTEGAALAIAILRNIHRRGAMCMATTHYSELKLFALSEPGVVNGSCEFDVKTLSPTYRLLIGVPGKSNAFAISGKLGLDAGIIEDAKKNLSESDKSFEDILAALEANRLSLEKERERVEEMKRQAQSFKDKSRVNSEKLEDSTSRILEEAKEEARRILQEAKATADETIRNFRKYGSIDQIREMEKDRERIRSSMKKVSGSEVREKIYVDDAAGRVDPKRLKKGDLVRVIPMNVNGTVSTLPDERGNLFVQCGILRSQVNVKDLAYTAEEAKQKKTGQRGGSGMSGIKMNKAANVSGEIKLIGMTVDEALAALDKYLDDAYLSGIEQVRIVHGKGTGALRKAVQQHLRHIKYVKSFRTAEYGEGDAGVTIAGFK